MPKRRGRIFSKKYSSTAYDLYKAEKLADKAGYADIVEYLDKYIKQRYPTFNGGNFNSVNNNAS